MDKFFLQGDYIRPTVSLDPETGRIELKGNFLCSETETGNINSKVFDWLNEYVKHPQKDTTISLELNAFNISASQKILKILYLLNQLYKAGHNVKAEWHFDKSNDDMEEVGKDFENMVDFPFYFVAHQKKDKLSETLF